MKKRMALLCALALMAAGCGGSQAQVVTEAEETTLEQTAATTEAEETTLEQTTAAATEAEAETVPGEIALRVGALKGPTSMGLAAMMGEHPEYEFVMETAADAVTASLIAGDLDIALVPANLASVLYNKTQGGVAVIDINTLSVLYLVSGEAEISAISDLEGKTVYLTGKGTTPDYVLQYLLAENGLSAESVTLEYKSEATEVASVLAEDPSAIGLLPQPFVTAACMQNDKLQIVLGLGDEWARVQEQEENPSALVTGVTVVRREVLEQEPELVAAFVEAHQKSAEAVNQDPETAAARIVELGIVAKEPIARAAIPMCGITCITGQEMKTALSGYLGVLFDQEPKSVGGALPEADFYYGAP